MFAAASFAHRQYLILSATSLTRSYSRKSVPTDIHAYLQNFALGYLSQRSTSEKHLAFVLRRRVTSLQRLASAVAARSRSTASVASPVASVVSATSTGPPEASIAAVSPRSRPVKPVQTHAPADIEAAIERVVGHFRERGVLDDALYAQKRAGHLRSQSRSARFIQQDLARKGIAPALVCSALEQTDRERTDIASDALNQSSGVNSRAHRPTFDGEHDEHENDEPSAESAADSDFLAALALTRKRRIGPFAASSSASASAAPESTTRAEYQRSLEKLVRAGFSFVTAKRALATRPDVAASFFARRDL